MNGSKIDNDKEQFIRISFLSVFIIDNNTPINMLAKFSIVSWWFIGLSIEIVVPDIIESVHVT